jgi:hypothetical protein
MQRAQYLPTAGYAGGSAPKLEGYTISPALASAVLPLAASFIVMAVDRANRHSPFVFSTVTNLCYILPGLHRELVAVAEDGHSTTELLGVLSGGPLYMVLLGAASFGFHSSPALGTYQHTADIMFGMLLVANAAYLTCGVALLYPLRGTQRLLFWARLALATAYATWLVFFMTFYGDFYARQLEFYLAAGGAAALGGAACRFLLTRDGRFVRGRAVLLAAAETVLVLVCVLSAVFVQSQLLGEKYETPSREFDFWCALRAAPPRAQLTAAPRAGTATGTSCSAPRSPFSSRAARTRPGSCSAPARSASARCLCWTRRASSCYSSTRWRRCS